MYSVIVGSSSGITAFSNLDIALFVSSYKNPSLSSNFDPSSSEETDPDAPKRNVFNS